MPPEEGQEVKELSLRDTLEASIASQETDDGTQETAAPADGAVARSTPAPDKQPQPADDAASETEGAKVEAKAGLKRDAKGRILPKEGVLPAAEEKPAVKGKEVKPEEEEQPQLAKSKAPSSWRPAMREKWAGLPADVQSEIIKREREIGQGFNEIGEIKKFRDSFLGTINPYAHVFASEGNQPLKTINDLLRTASVFYSGAPMQKAQTMAAMIQNFGIDIQLLDNILSGASGQATGQQGQQGGRAVQGGPDLSQLVQQAVQNALAPVLQGQQQAAAREEQQASQSIEDFANDPKNEFFEDVKDTMADILEAAAKRGTQMDLSTAYNRAILAHNDIADVVADRRLKEKTAVAHQAAQSARRKAVSISGAPALETSSSSGNSIRDSINSAIEQLGA